MAIIYIHKKKGTDEIFYVGRGIDKRRAFDLANRNKYWKNIVAKYDYDIEILFDNLTHEEANLKEKELILKYGRRDLKTGSLVNLTDGGDGVIGCLCSDEKRKKISIAKKGWISPKRGIKITSKETLKKMSEVQKGKKHSEETRLKMSESRKGKKISEEHRQIIIHHNKTRIRTEATRKKMSESKIKMSSETKIKIGLNNPRTKIMMNIQTGIFYNSMKEAAFYENVKYNTLKGIYRTNGYKNHTNLIMV